MAALLLLILGLCGSSPAQQAPSAAGARTLLFPKKIVSGEKATLAVLDLNGRLTPGVKVNISNGDQYTTDATGRVLFVAPLTLGPISAWIEGRAGRVSSTVVEATDSPTNSMEVLAAPRASESNDRLEIQGHGFCGEADTNQVSIAGIPALVLASSPAYLAVLPPDEMDPGLAKVEVNCTGKTVEPFLVVFISLDLQASGAALAPGEHRTLTVRLRGSTAKLSVEARNLAPEFAELASGANTARVVSSGGADNVAKFEIIGKKHGNFGFAFRLPTPLTSPRR